MDVSSASLAMDELCVEIGMKCLVRQTSQQVIRQVQITFTVDLMLV